MNLSSELPIKQLNISHVHDVAKLEAISFSLPWTYEQLVQALDNNAYAMFGFYVKEDLASYISIYLTTYELEILNIATHPDYKQQGYAKKLIKFCKEIAQAKKLERIILDVRPNNTPALNLYYAQGFTQVAVRKNYYPDTNEDALVLVVNFT